MPSRVPVSIAAVVLALGGCVLGARAAAADPPVVYEAPLDGGVVRGFEPPLRSWGSGHRGVDLAALPGDAARAAADGTVTFAGAVAGERWVSVRHDDGVVTSYGPLGIVTAEPGARLVRGGVVGTVAPGHRDRGWSLHWGARRDGEYIDPLSLLEPVRWRPALVGPGRTRVGDPPAIERYAPWEGRRGIRGALGFVEGSSRADPDGDGYLLPPNPNHVIGVAGLGSHTDRLPIVLTQLGYAPRDATYLSYAGRTSAVGAEDDPHRDQLDYGPAETFAGVHAAAERLAAQLRAQWARSPGQAVDLIGHSMGGVVITYYLTTMHDPADPTLPPIAHIVTLGSPLEGTDLADAALAATRSELVLGTVLGGAALIDQEVPRPTDQVSDDLRLGSAVVAATRAAWQDARTDVHAGPLATGTRVLTFGGSRDVVVPDHRSALQDNPHVVLPGGHDRMRRTEASRVAVRAFLADEPVPGATGGVGHGATRLLGYSQRVAGRALGTLGAPGAPFIWPAGGGWRTLLGDR